MCVCLCVHSIFMGSRIELCDTGSAHVGETSDSSDRRAQVTVWYEQKYTDHFWWDFLFPSLQQPFDRGGRSVKPHISCAFGCILGLKLQSYDSHRQFCLDTPFFPPFFKVT